MTSKYYYLITWDIKPFGSVKGYIFTEEEIIKMKDDEDDFPYEYNCTIRCCREEIYDYMCDTKNGKAQIYSDKWHGFKIIPVPDDKDLDEDKLQKYIDSTIEYAEYEDC